MQNALKELILQMADDALVLGHRNSEWTGIGPMLEEDLAFSSMAQDKIGHALALYTILHEHMGEPDPDKLGFMRKEEEYRCCQFVELPIGEYDFTLARHFLYDHAELIRYEMLVNCPFEPLAQMARKVRGELKYHVLHADTFLRELARGTEESKARMQAAIRYAWPYALGMFEITDADAQLAAAGAYAGEKERRSRWLSTVSSIINDAGLQVPEPDEAKAIYGGRKGYHSEYLKPLLDEMTEVVRLDPTAEW
ncbi:MAG: phenylacetate-CoA oxygenase subunit PaaC [Chitinophagales bacterium]|nr:phenylacetate-CoA oxygenase subunit PaaC [Chitinophagales bacterium]MDW8419295.1 1,2-phenylacetyl-CoA epoxidase subunit PaaC [Chitinophagales bacterium]